MESKLHYVVIARWTQISVAFVILCWTIAGNTYALLLLFYARLPWYTKFVVLLTGFFSVAMFAIPASSK